MAVTIEEQVIIDLSLDIKGLVAEMKVAQQAVQRSNKNMSKQFDETTRSIKRTASAVTTLAATVVGAYGIRAAKAIAHTADTWNLLEGRVKLVSKTYDELIQKQEALFKIAQDSRVGYEQTADLYARIARNTARMNITDKTRLDVTDAISKSLIISGASAESANAALVQLGQGLAAEALRGQELNSVMEQTPRLAQMISDGMGVSIGALRALAEQGKLTSKVVVEAIASQQDAVTEEFLQMPITMAQGYTVLTNELMRFTGELDDQLGLTEAVVGIYYDMVKYFHEATEEYKTSGTGMIDTMQGVMATADKWADVMVYGMVLVRNGYVDLYLYGKYVIISTGDAILHTVDILLAGIQTLIQSAKLKLMEFIRWASTLTSGGSTIIDLSPVSEEDLKNQTTLVNNMKDAYKDLGDGVSDEAKRAKKIAEENLAWNARLTEAAKKRADVTIAARKAEIKAAAAARLAAKQFDKSGNKPIDIKDIVDTKGLAKAARAAAKAAREALQAQKDRMSLIMAEAKLKIEYIKLAYDELGILMTQREERAIALQEASIIVEQRKQALALVEAEAGASSDPKVRLKVIAAEVALVKAKQKEAKLSNKLALDTAKKLKSMGSNFMDALTDGDFKGAMKGLFDDMVNIFLDPIKDQISTLFGNSFSKIVSTGIEAVMGTMATATTQSIANSQAIGAASAPAAVGKAGAMSGWPGAIAMIALMAGLGYAMSGSSAPTMTKEDYQEANGVVNSPESESVINLLESMDWSLTRDLTYSKGIYDNLSNLVRQSGAAAVSLSGTADFSNKDASSVGGFLGFSSKDVNTLFTGLDIQFKGLYDVLAQTRDVTQTTKTSWWGLSSKTSTSTVVANVDGGTQQAINDAYISGISALMEASEALGVQGAESVVDSFTGSLHRLNLEGKGQDEIAAMISGAISADLDAIANKIAPWLQQFQKAGEGSLETMGRLAYETEVVSYALGRLNVDMMATGYQVIRMSQAFIEASGGLDNALSNVNGYIDNFYSDAEKQALRAKELANSSGLFENEEAYRAQVDYLSAGAAQGNQYAAELLADLLRNQQTYRDYFDFMNEVVDTGPDTSLDERRAELEAELAFHKEILSQIESAYSGAANYMNSIEKANALANIAQQKLGAGDTQGYFDTLYSQLAEEKKTATTREEYAVKFDRYIGELQGAEQPKTTDDVVDSLEELIAQNEKIEEAIARAAYQPTLSTSYEGV